ncbi:hypothetical protein BLNAU_8391 [Blattamonas nauphoetae]|uniref:Uncharacterized protein n=1 Tax=Blattamonas nauphoetae TaxID=2049346 RepID=A0ABQ9XYH9_9EUKA|nr:hypothetical protein BLNAU_8391 [Blattamonas nauphoetae]
MLVPLRPFLIRHLKYSTSFSDSERHRAVPFSRYDSHWPKKQLSPNKQYFPFLTFFRQFASLQHGQNEFVAFLAELMQEVWEERRREGLVLDGPDPLFVSTPLRTNMTPPEMVPLLDSASAILASTRPLSDFDAVTVTLFLTSFENMIFIRTEKGRVEFSSTFADSLSSCPPFARSLATLILLSLTSSPFESWAERREFWLDCIFSQQFNLMSVANHVFFPLLAEEAQTLQTGWSDESILEVHSFFTDIVELSVRMITPCGSTLKTDSDIEHFQKTQQIVVSNVLAPLRQSLVLFARTNTRIVPHFDFLSFQEINHPNIVRFFSGVWEEVRREAIEVVCGEDEAEAPVFLTMDLFSCLSMEETELGLSSLSSYLSTTPSPPQIVIACIHLFLRTITNVSSLSLSEQKKIRARSAWARIDSQLQVWIRSHRSFAFCFSETVPTLLLSRNDDIQVDSRWMVDFILEYSSNPSEIVLSLAEAGLVSNLALVLMNTQSRTNSRDFIKHANSRCFLKIVKASLSVIPTSVHMSFKDQLRENERRARILVEKVLVPSQPFLISLLAPLSLSRGVDEAISDLKELLLAIGTAEWYCPKLTESLARCGFHVATMRLCDLTEKTEFQVCLLALTVNPKYDSGIINRHQSSSKAVNSASSKLTVPTLRERMKGRNEEGQEDLIEEVMLGRPLTDYFRDIQSRTNRFINNTGFNTFR